MESEELNIRIQELLSRSLLLPSTPLLSVIIDMLSRDVSEFAEKYGDGATDVLGNLECSISGLESQNTPSKHLSFVKNYVSSRRMSLG